MITRRSMIKAALAAVPVAVLATAPAEAAEHEIVIDENIHDDARARKELLAWAESNGMGDPMDWGMPVIVRPGEKTITAPYYPGGLDSSYHYERTIPLRVPLPASLV